MSIASTICRGVAGVLFLLAAPLAAQTAAETAASLAARTRGAATAPITIYEMSDFQCPYCRRVALNTFPDLDREYIATGKVRWVFINFPLTMIHPNAAAAAEVALCAARSGKFWEVHDLLYRNQPTWAPLTEPGAFFLTLADSASIPPDAFRKCLVGRETLDEVASDAKGSVQAGASSTPSFYIEGGLLPGAQPVEVFRQILDSIYIAKTAPTP
jgi:protein-disulfide isomerase